MSDKSFTDKQGNACKCWVEPGYCSLSSCQTEYATEFHNAWGFLCLY